MVAITKDQTLSYNIADCLYTLGGLQACNNSNIVKLMPALFASNTPFFGTDLEDFEAHVTGLSSVLPRDFDTTAHQPVLENDEDSRKI